MVSLSSAPNIRSTLNTELIYFVTHVRFTFVPTSLGLGVTVQQRYRSGLINRVSLTFNLPEHQEVAKHLDVMTQNN